MLLGSGGDLLAVAGLVKVVTRADSGRGAQDTGDGGFLLTGESLALFGRTGATGGSLLANTPLHAFDAVVCEDLVLVNEEQTVCHFSISCVER